MKESGMKESEIKESEIKESGIKGSEIKESEIKESEIKGSEIKGSEIRESGIKESGIKRSGIKESEIKGSGRDGSGIKGSGSKERLDVLLVGRGLASSREKAKAIIMSGNVLVNGEREDKAGALFADTAKIVVKGPAIPYVSRGGLKLEKAMACFGIDLKGKICMDVGASTGGFTDCMLQNGARKVYAIDVGHGQLDWKLRSDERVVCMERTNIRYVTPEQIPDPCQFASIDISFISLTMALPVVWKLLLDGGETVCLIKPQFEAGREKVGKKGVVRDPEVHREVIEKIMDFAEGLSFQIRNLDFSPIKGPEGNIEYLLHIQKPSGESCQQTVCPDPWTVVQAAHRELSGK